jgi:hypothetical protein
MAEPTLDKSLSEIPSERRLDSWKEIGLYLHRDVTTVQRWEKQEGMPVHRHLHHKRGSVYALSSELDAWRQSRKLRFEDEPEPALEAVPDPDDQQTTVPGGRRWFVLGSAAVVLAALQLEWRSVAGLRRRRHDRGTHWATFQNSRITGYISHFKYALQEHAAFSAGNCQNARCRCDC